MKTSKTPLKIHCTAVAAALMAATCFGNSAYAQVLPAAPAPAASVNQSNVPVQAAPQKLQVFETSPDVRQATAAAMVKTPAKADGGPQLPGGGSTLAPVVTAPVSPVTPDPDVTWLLDVTTRPWPLAHSEPSPINALYFSLPTERESRILLPGAISDLTDNVRVLVSRYITDNIGTSAQIRGRQLEAFTAWAANTSHQKTFLDKNPWSAYQFNKEARTLALTFKEKVSTQSEPGLQKMAKDINEAVTKIAPIMAVMATYEQKMQWYNLLVQLKEGMSLYQARVADSDHQILAAIEAFEAENPAIVRPTEAPPVRPSLDGTGPSPTLAPKDISLVKASREPAKAPQKVAESGFLSGGMVLGIVGILMLGFLWFLRKRINKKGASAPAA